MAKKTPPKPFSLTTDQVERLQADILALVEPLLDAVYYLVDVSLEKEAGQWYLRVYVEKQGFEMSLKDCEIISRLVDPEIEARLDKHADYRELPYILEVSSPGLFRSLRNEREFRYYLGRPVKVTWPERKQSEEGILAGFDPVTGTLTIKSSEAPDATVIALTYDSETMTVSLNPIIHIPESQMAP